MFGTLGGPELLLIFVLALIVFGPRKLPEIGRSIGRMMGEFRRASNEFRRTLEDEVEAENDRPTVPPAFDPAVPPPPMSDPAGTVPVDAMPPLGPVPAPGAGGDPATPPSGPGEPVRHPDPDTVARGR